MAQYRAEILTIFRSCFGRNNDLMNSFWNLLTFRDHPNITYGKVGLKIVTFQGWRKVWKSEGGLQTCEFLTAWFHKFIIPNSEDWLVRNFLVQNVDGSGIIAEILCETNQKLGEFLSEFHLGKIHRGFWYDSGWDFKRWWGLVSNPKKLRFAQYELNIIIQKN